MMIRRINKSLTTSVIMVFFLVILSPTLLLASVFRSNENIAVARDEVVSDDLYIFGNYSEVRGMVEGDLTAFCYDISSNGNIQSNANIFAYNIDFIGKIGRAARLFGFKVRINGPIVGNMLVFGNDVRLGPKAYVGRDLTFYAENMKIDGTVHGNIDGNGGRTVISGTIEGKVCIETNRLIITSPAVIKGELCYTSPEEAIIDEDVIIEGETIWHEKGTGDKENGGSETGSYITKAVLFLMSLVTGFILIMLFRSHFEEAVGQIEGRFWYTLAIGCLSFIALTFGAIIPAVLIIGIPISIMMFALGMILFYIGKIYVGIALARYLFRLISRDTKLAIGIELLIGLILLVALFEMPFLGWIIYILAFLLGTGAAVNGFLAQCRRQKAAPQTTQG